MVYLQRTHPMPSAQHVLGPQTRFENDLLCQHHTVLRSEATLQSQNDSKALISSTSEKKTSIGSTSYNVQQQSDSVWKLRTAKVHVVGKYRHSFCHNNRPDCSTGPGFWNVEHRAMFSTCSSFWEFNKVFDLSEFQHWAKRKMKKSYIYLHIHYLFGGCSHIWFQTSSSSRYETDVYNQPVERSHPQPVWVFFVGPWDAMHHFSVQCPTAVRSSA